MHTNEKSLMMGMSLADPESLAMRRNAEQA
jgi:hypothetical protein